MDFITVYYCNLLCHFQLLAFNCMAKGTTYVFHDDDSLAKVLLA